MGPILCSQLDHGGWGLVPVAQHPGDLWGLGGSGIQPQRWALQPLSSHLYYGGWIPPYGEWGACTPWSWMGAQEETAWHPAPTLLSGHGWPTRLAISKDVGDLSLKKGGPGWIIAPCRPDAC